MAWETATAFTSSNISDLRYDESSSILEVWFKNGGIYQYFDIPRQVWEGLNAAGSKGEYLHQHIKGNYRYSKV